MLLTFEMYVKVKEYNFGINTPFDGKCRNLQTIPNHVCARSYHLRYIKIYYFYLQKVGQGHIAQFFH